MIEVCTSLGSPSAGNVEAGGKATNLHKLTSAGFRVPHGFVILATVFQRALDKVRRRLPEFDARLSDSSANPASKICYDFCREAKGAFADIQVPQSEIQEIENFLSTFPKDCGLAIRSSATVEDSNRTSWAGQFDTLLNVGPSITEVMNAVKKVWASVFSPKTLNYAKRMNISLDVIHMAVIVQELVVQPDFSGVLFTHHPSGKPGCLYIEFVQGYGDSLVSGHTTPASYTMHRDDTPALDSVSTDMSLSCQHLKRLRDNALSIEELFDSPQDIEWSLKEGKIYVLQSRPISAYSDMNHNLQEFAEEKAIVKGLPAAGGTGSGQARLVFNIADAVAMLDGEVLVAPMTNPDMVPYMSRANAIITDVGGMICHTAIVAREMGIPCVVGTGNATKKIADSAYITVDGNTGSVYAGHKMASSVHSNIDWLGALLGKVNSAAEQASPPLIAPTARGLSADRKSNVIAELLRIKSTEKFFGHIPEQVSMAFPYPPRQGPWWPEHWQYPWTMVELTRTDWGNIRPEIVNTPLTKSIIVQGIESIPFVFDMPKPKPLFTRWRKCRVHINLTQLDSVRMFLAKRLVDSPIYCSQYVDDLHDSYSDWDEKTAKVANELQIKQLAVAELILRFKLLWKAHERFFALCFLIQTIGDDLVWPIIEKVARYACLSRGLPNNAATFITRVLASPPERTLSSLYLDSIDELFQHREGETERSKDEAALSWRRLLKKHIRKWGWMRDRDLYYSPLNTESAVENVLDRYRSLRREPPDRSRWDKARNALCACIPTDQMRERFSHLVHLGVRLHVERENHHIIWVRNVDTMRTIVLQVAEHLHRNGRLTTHEDVFFLYLPEIFSMCENYDAVGADVIANRKRAFLQEARQSRSDRTGEPPHAEEDYY